MFDKVSRVRLETINLLSICMDQENVRNDLVPSLIEETKNGNYLYRETVLFFIKETYRLVPENIKLMYRGSIELLIHDPV